MMPNGTNRDLRTWAPFLVGNMLHPEFRMYNAELRNLIARCMADDRRDRPYLDELLYIVQQNIANVDAAAAEASRKWEEEKRNDPAKQKPPVDVKAPPAVEDDDLLRRFFQEYLRQPPIREDPYKDLWNQ
ncbi:hypothetical protein F4677DRAFT_415627 [Hypoxylon crocopeplum]|nr:hypothetical protein F4677DRAFT_415627 [Hypoxylon crocopeplum]